MSAAELFAGAGQSPGVEIWRIEAMKPVKQTDVTSGKFFSGDSYIVLHTFTERTGQIAMNAHFWLGSESSQDERGAAALLTVELDQFLDDLPTQYRECQGSESSEFLQLFKNGVRYLEGGVDSAFNKVDRDAHTTTLLHVKGNRSVRVMSAPLALELGDHRTAQPRQRLRVRRLTREVRRLPRIGGEIKELLLTGRGDENVLEQRR